MLRNKTHKKPSTKKSTKTHKKAVHKTQKRNFVRPEGYEGPTFGKSVLGKKIPKATAQVVNPDGTVAPFNTDSDLSGYSVICTLPLAFTFVCPTEVNALSDATSEFNKLGAKVYALSIDSPFAIAQWMKQPRKQGGIEGSELSFIADMGRDVSNTLGCLLPANITTRATYVLKDGVLRHASFNETNVGRSVDEILRVTASIVHVDQNAGTVIPCGWEPKKPKTMKPTAEGLKEYVNDV